MFAEREQQSVLQGDCQSQLLPYMGNNSETKDCLLTSSGVAVPTIFHPTEVFTTEVFLFWALLRDGSFVLLH